MMEKSSLHNSDRQSTPLDASPPGDTRLPEVCRDQERFFRPTLDALPAHIAILDDKGEIRVVNDAWRRFAERNGVAAESVSEGVNYLKICDEASGDSADEAKPFAAAIRRILTGDRTAYQKEYPCHSPDRERWFLGCVAPFPGNGTRHVMVAHFDVSETKRMRRALQDTERRFRDAFTHAPIGMALLDLDGRFRHVNEAYCRITGYSEAELLGGEMTFEQLSHPDDRPGAMAEMRRVVEGETPAFFVEKRYRRKDGRVTWVRISASLRRSVNGGPVQIVGLVEDIDERKRTEKALAESEKQYRELVETANSIIMRWDHRGIIRFINDYGVRYFGYRKTELIGKPIMTIVPPVEKSTGRDLDALVRDIVRHPGLYTSMPCENLRSDGSSVWVAWTNKAILDEEGRVQEILAIGNDITELKEAEAALRRSNEELEQFAYVASHDLQEPLRSVVGFLQLLQQRYVEHLDDRGRHYIERSVAAGHRMQTLIRDLLTLSRVHTKGAEFAPADLGVILDKVLDHLDPFLREKNAEVVRAAMPVLPVDEPQIQSLFQNLIANAVKYNESPRPRIQIGVRERGDVYEFSVKDNGIGIAARFHARIFMVFQRLHTDREYPGTGLGLALCQKIVERHGGAIWVASQPQEGSTFYFSLPKYRRKG